MTPFHESVRGGFPSRFSVRRYLVSVAPTGLLRPCVLLVSQLTSVWTRVACDFICNPLLLFGLRDDAANRLEPPTASTVVCWSLLLTWAETLPEEGTKASTRVGQRCTALPAIATAATSGIFIFSDSYHSAAVASARKESCLELRERRRWIFCLTRCDTDARVCAGQRFPKKPRFWGFQIQ